VIGIRRHVVAQVAAVDVGEVELPPFGRELLQRRNGRACHLLDASGKRSEVAVEPLLDLRHLRNERPGGLMLDPAGERVDADDFAVAKVIQEEDRGAAFPRSDLEDLRAAAAQRRQHPPPDPEMRCRPVGAEFAMAEPGTEAPLVELAG
jgi:hypothetical protein